MVSPRAFGLAGDAPLHKIKPVPLLLITPGGEPLVVEWRAEHDDSWRVVRDGIAPDSKWLPFVDNWAGETLGQYVAYLEDELDQLAGAVGSEERERMAELFELTTRYEIAFWEMAAVGETWPGIPEDVRC
jgi:hypothetical protein